MRKTLLLLTLCLGANGVAQAQTRLGIKIGAGLANISGTQLAAGAKSIVTTHGGLMANIALTSDGFLAVQPELLYSQKGFEESYTNTPALRTRFHYLDLPVLARINADGFIFEAGPQAGYLVAASREQPTGPGTKTKFTGTDGLERLDFGYVAGVGYQTAGPVVGLRYNGGLTSPGSGRNSVFQLYLGYFFGAK
ncbi:hypothetical protein GCM10027048_13060 [Hymenobacter coalescens]